MNLVPIITQIKYSLYFLLFGIFIGAYFDYLQMICSSLKNKKKKIFKSKVITNIIVYLTMILLLGLLIHISLEYTYKVSNGYAPIQISLFFIGGYIIYQFLLRKANHKQMFIIGYYLYKFKVFKAIKEFFKNIFYNVGIINLFKRRNKKKVD